MTSDQPGGQQMVIWGTNVVVTETKDKFQRFVERFIDHEADPSEGINPHEPLYLQKLEEVFFKTPLTFIWDALIYLWRNRGGGLLFQ